MADQLVVVLVLEVLPGELAVLELREDGSQRIAQFVLPARPALDVLVQPHRPVAAGAQLLPLEVEEFVGRHVLRSMEAAVQLQHDGEDDAVEDDVVLADEVQQARVVRLPPFFPINAPVSAHCFVAEM